MWSNRAGVVFVAVVAVLVALVAVPSEAAAAPASSRIVAEQTRGGERVDLTVYSKAMRGEVPVTVLTPGGSSPRPTLYLLDGADAGEEVSDWLTKGGAEAFFAGKNVNVVLPAGGAGSFYTDWIRKDRHLGKPQWETFLTKELPPLVDARFHGNGANAVMGLSMGGQAAYTLAVRNPALYRGVASLSGCPPVSGPANEAYVRTTVAKSGGDANNMWGVPGSPRWRAHDPSLHVDALRGKALYLSSGSGAIGPEDLTAPRDPKDGPADAQIAAGSALEMGAYRCSLEFAAVLRANNVDFTPGFRFIGTHSWTYWKQDLPNAWAAISPALYH